LHSPSHKGESNKVKLIGRLRFYFNSFFVIGRLKQARQHNAKGEKNFAKNGDDLFILDFFVVLGENI
jgi:hypothetical protein